MSQLASLRALIATRFPERNRAFAGVLSTGSEALDEAMGGGLPLGCVSEWVAAAPSSGTQLALTEVICSMREKALRLALVDAADTFAPEELPEICREHVVWVRACGLEAALAAADLLLHDGNLRLVILDVRETPARALQAMAQTLWYRLQRTVEDVGAVLLACTPHPLVPSAAVRISFNARPTDLAERLVPSSTLIAGLSPERLRVRAAAQPASRLARAV